MLILALITIITTIIILSPPPKLNATSDDFVITVKTNNYGFMYRSVYTSDTQFKIPTFDGEIYNYNVDCDNDGIDEATVVRGDYTCNYSRPGTYTIIIKDNTGSGDGFPRIYFNNNGDAPKIISINQWGTMHWSSMENAFWGCDGLNDIKTRVGVATDTPDLSKVRSLAHMFHEARSFNQPINSWDTSNVVNMEAMFSNVYSFNQPLDAWNTSNVVNMKSMFNTAYTFNQSINSWNTSNVIPFLNNLYSMTTFQFEFVK